MLAHQAAHAEPANPPLPPEVSDTYAVELNFSFEDISAGSFLMARPIVPEIGALALLKLRGEDRIFVVRARTSCTPPQLKGDVIPVILFDFVGVGSEARVALDDVASIHRVTAVFTPFPN